MSSKPALGAPTSTKGGNTPLSNDPRKNPAARQQFIAAVLNMSWQLAVVVVIPIAAGAWLDNKLHAGNLWVFVGLAVALVGSTAVVWRIVQLANRLPVPKLTEAERRAIRKSYEEDDE